MYILYKKMKWLSFNFKQIFLLKIVFILFSSPVYADIFNIHERRLRQQESDWRNCEKIERRANYGKWCGYPGCRIDPNLMHVSTDGGIYALVYDDRSICQKSWKEQGRNGVTRVAYDYPPSEGAEVYGYETWTFKVDGKNLRKATRRVQTPDISVYLQGKYSEEIGEIRIDCWVPIRWRQSSQLHSTEILAVPANPRDPSCLE